MGESFRHWYSENQFDTIAQFVYTAFTAQLTCRRIN